MSWPSSSTPKVHISKPSLITKLTSAGYHVIGTARRAEVLQGLKDLGMSAVSLDVTSTTSINECEAEVSKITGGKLDILVNNA